MVDKYRGEYTPDQLRSLLKKYGSILAMSNALGIGRRGLQQYLKRNNLHIGQGARGVHGRYTIEKPVAGGNVHETYSQREKLKGKRFVFTAAQNNTYVHKGFFASLETFCKVNKAQLIVSRFAYNQSGYQNNMKDGEDLWYDKKLTPYILDNSVQVCDGLIYCGELDILPTAIDPLSGFDSYCGSSSGIIPHVKVAMKSLPRLKGEDARFLYTTGAVTLRNYIKRKAGQKAEFHHVYGALYVEIDNNGVWFARQLIADSKGEFHDLKRRYAADKVSTAPVLSINWGDIHIEKEDRLVSKASWESPNSMLRTLSPVYQLVHDLTDFSARNHHNVNDPYFIAEKFFRGEDSVEEGLDKSAEFLDKIQKVSKVIVVESNHHEAYQRWLRTAAIHNDPINAEFFHESNYHLFRAIRLGDKDFDIYKWALTRKKELKNVKFLKDDESFVIANLGKANNGIECGLHGHRGINGARGQSSAFRSIGKRVNVGHTHSAGIIDGVYTAGVSGKLDMDYNKGPSSWSHSHIVTYQNGKRAIITIKNGKWKA